MFPWEDLSTPQGQPRELGEAAQTEYQRFLGFNPKVCFDSTWFEFCLLKKHNLSLNDAMCTEIKS